MKQAERVAVTRAKLVDAVFSLRKKESDVPLTVTAVCRAADVTKPTFYQYFRSVDALVAEACEGALEEQFDEVRELVGTHGGENVDLDGTVRAYLRDLLDRNRQVFVAVRDSGPETRDRAVATVAARLVEWYSTASDGLPQEELAFRARFAAAGVLSVVAGSLGGGVDVVPAGTDGAGGIDGAVDNPEVLLDLVTGLVSSAFVPHPDTAAAGQ